MGFSLVGRIRGVVVVLVCGGGGGISSLLLPRRTRRKDSPVAILTAQVINTTTMQIIIKCLFSILLRSVKIEIGTIHELRRVVVDKKENQVD
jgi:predicted aconitase with swiveling domain